MGRTQTIDFLFEKKDNNFTIHIYDIYIYVVIIIMVKGLAVWALRVRKKKIITYNYYYTHCAHVIVLKYTHDTGGSRLYRPEPPGPDQCGGGGGGVYT